MGTYVRNWETSLYGTFAESIDQETLDYVSDVLQCPMFSTRTAQNQPLKVKVSYHPCIQVTRRHPNAGYYHLSIYPAYSSALTSA